MNLVINQEAQFSSEDMHWESLTVKWIFSYLKGVNLYIIETFCRIAMPVDESRSRFIQSEKKTRSDFYHHAALMNHIDYDPISSRRFASRSQETLFGELNFDIMRREQVQRLKFYAQPGTNSASQSQSAPV